jgi:hypothetical protein
LTPWLTTALVADTGAHQHDLPEPRPGPTDPFRY